MHGDLAARNVLLSTDNIVKICDFGLSKDLHSNPSYQKKSDSPLPVKWLAIETLNYRYFVKKVLMSQLLFHSELLMLFIDSTVLLHSNYV